MCQLECRLRVARKGLTAGSGRYPAYLPACVRGPEAGAGSCGSVGNRRCEREGTYRRKEGVEPRVRLHRTRRRGGLQKAGNGASFGPREPRRMEDPAYVAAQLQNLTYSNLRINLAAIGPRNRAVRRDLYGSSNTPLRVPCTAAVFASPAFQSVGTPGIQSSIQFRPLLIAEFVAGIVTP